MFTLAAKVHEMKNLQSLNEIIPTRTLTETLKLFSAVPAKVAGSWMRPLPGAGLWAQWEEALDFEQLPVQRTGAPPTSGSLRRSGHLGISYSHQGRAMKCQWPPSLQDLSSRQEWFCWLFLKVTFISEDPSFSISCFACRQSFQSSGMCQRANVQRVVTQEIPWLSSICLSFGFLSLLNSAWCMILLESHKNLEGVGKG